MKYSSSIRTQRKVKMSPPRALERETDLVTTRIFSDDMEYLKLCYTGVGYNSVIRGLVARHVRKLRSKTVENLDDSEKLTREELENV